MQSGKACGAACGDDVFQLLACKIRSVLAYHDTWAGLPGMRQQFPKGCLIRSCLSATPSALSA